MHKWIFVNNFTVTKYYINYIIEICTIMNIFSIYIMIFVSVKFFLGSWPTCQPEWKIRMVDSVNFKF